MITLAKILEINTKNNLCKVNIPILEGAGNKVRVDLWATMLLPPGIHSGYQKDDTVFISFVDNSLGQPVVLGKLYQSDLAKIENEKQIGSISCASLEVEQTAKLPLETVISGTRDYRGKEVTLKTLVERAGYFT
jgi:hypothetical protein